MAPLLPAERTEAGPPAQMPNPTRNRVPPGCETNAEDQVDAADLLRNNKQTSKVILAKGRITVVSTPAAASAFVCRVRWAGTFAHGSRLTMRNALMHTYITMGTRSPKKCPFPSGWTPNIWLTLFQISSKSAHFRQSYSRTPIEYFDDKHFKPIIT